MASPTVQPGLCCLSSVSMETKSHLIFAGYLYAIKDFILNIFNDGNGRFLASVRSPGKDES